MFDATPSGKTNQYSESEKLDPLTRENSSDAALRGYKALGLKRKQDRHPPIQPDTTGAWSHPYGG